MSEHTKEPWVVNMDSTCSGAWPEIGTYDSSEGFQDIGRMGTSHVFDHENYDPSEYAATYQEAPHMFKLAYDGEEMIANARRIVAAVNACAGVPLDWLESGTVGCVQNVRIERDKYLRQRDDLLAACKKAEEWLTGWASAEPYLSIIREAIANAEPKP